MRALLDDAALIHDHQPVHAGDGRQPMCDGDHGLAAHQHVEARLDRGLDLAVERRGGLVEHQNRRVLEDDARDGDTLALAAGQFDAALADMGVSPPLLDPEDEVARVAICAAATISLLALGCHSGCCRIERQ